VRIAGRSCDRLGQYRRVSLVVLYGDKAPLPDVLGQRAHDCPMRGAISNQACGAYFQDLVERPPRRPQVGTHWR
jgi:hypothetical protein